MTKTLCQDKTAKRINRKNVTKLLRRDALNAIETLQIRAEQDTGSEAATHSRDIVRMVETIKIRREKIDHNVENSTLL